MRRLVRQPTLSSSACLSLALCGACAVDDDTTDGQQTAMANQTEGGDAKPAATQSTATSSAAAGTSATAPTGSPRTSAGAGANAQAMAATAAAGRSGQVAELAAAAGSGAAGSSAAGSGAAGSSAAGSGAAGSRAGSGTAGSDPAATGGNATSMAESFEAGSGEMLDASWEVSTTNCMGTGTVTMDNAQAHQGARSVRVNGGGGYCNHVFFRPKTSPWMAGLPVYARFFVRLEKPLTQSHVTFLALRDDSEMKDLRMGGQSEILMWNRESDDATLPELSPTGIAMSAKPEPGKWLCIELLIDGQTPKLETWLNGEPVAGLVVEGDPTPDVDAQWQRKPDWRPSLSDIRFGWESYGSDENTLWFDDVVLGTSRAGCGS